MDCWAPEVFWWLADKIEEGYMSSNIYYVTDPFTVEQGLTTYSEAVELDTFHRSGKCRAIGYS